MEDLRTRAKEVLSPKEYGIFKMIYPQSGVLFLKGKPGIGKSAICKSIADKLNLQYIDLRLTQVDETDIGMFPVLKGDGDEKVLAHAIPEWAQLANEKPTLIHFEELNRASLSVRNAALQMLNERTIGFSFKFNKNVFMVSSGNKGDEDSTTVEEFDSALKTRLLIKHYDLSLQEWMDNYANNNITPTILQYLQNKPGDFYKFNEEEDAHATPRGWTFLSDFIKSGVVDEKNPKEIYEHIIDSAGCYIGASASGYLRYLEDMSLISINDILYRYDEVKKKIKSMSMSRKTELVESLKDATYDINDLSVINNINSFLDVLEDDQKTSFMTHLVDKFDVNTIKTTKLANIVRKHKDLIKYISKS